MNIFKKIALINKVLTLINNLKKHFDNNKITDVVKEKAENLVNAIKEFAEVVPAFKNEIMEVSEIIKKAFSKKGK